MLSTALLFLKSLNPKTIIAAIILFVVLGFGMKVYFTIEHLKAQHEKDTNTITQLNQDINTLKQNIVKLNEVNSSNELVISQLKQERQDAVDQVEILSKKNAETAKKYDNLSKKISGSKNTKDDGQIAKVLKDTIDNLQQGQK